IGEYCMNKTGQSNIKGDNDPLDICVITERNIPHGNLIMDAIPLGGLRMIYGEAADDKIIAVLSGDATFGHMRDISEVSERMVVWLSHYILTSKQRLFNNANRACEITVIYNHEEALEVIDRSRQDHNTRFNTETKELF